LEESGKDIMKGNVMVSRHDDLWFRQIVEERARLLELVRTCALCEIAGACDEIRVDFSDDFFQRVDQQRVYAPEVQVRQMNYGSHTLVTQLLHRWVQSRGVHGSEPGNEVVP